MGDSKSYPESADFDKLRYEVAAEVECDEGFKAADIGATDENGRSGCGCGGGEGGESVDLVVV